MYFKYDAHALAYLKKKDKVLAIAIEKIGMIEREINLEPFAALIQQVIAQQVSKQAAITVFNRLKLLSKEMDAAHLANLSIEAIQGCGMTFIKARNIQRISELVATKEIDLEGLSELSDDQVIKEMVKLPGIGVWSAQMYLLFTLERMNIISYDDLAIRKGIIKLYNLEKLDKKSFLEYKKNYEPYASVASLYLWHIAHNDI